MRRMREICETLNASHAEIESGLTKWADNALVVEYQRHLRWSMARLELSIAISKRIGVRKRQLEKQPVR